MKLYKLLKLYHIQHWCSYSNEPFLPKLQLVSAGATQPVPGSKVATNPTGLQGMSAYELPLEHWN